MLGPKYFEFGPTTIRKKFLDRSLDSPLHKIIVSESHVARSVSCPYLVLCIPAKSNSKPKNARSARALAARAPQLHENTKTTLFLKATTSSDLLNKLTTNIHSLKKPFSQRFSKKNPIHPFEDASSLEFFSEKNDTSLMVFSSHSKKRPHCMTFVRMFDGKVLDMLEAMVDPATARTLEQFSTKNRVAIGTKPLISFSGPGFASGETSSKFGIARSLFLDLFRGEEASDVDVEGLQMMITFTSSEEESTISGTDNKQRVHMRVWRIITKRSGQKLPRVELEEIGPRIDFKLGRCQFPDSSIIKEALKKGKSSEVSIGVRL